MIGLSKSVHQLQQVSQQFTIKRSTSGGYFIPVLTTLEHIVHNEVTYEKNQLFLCLAER